MNRSMLAAVAAAALLVAGCSADESGSTSASSESSTSVAEPTTSQPSVTTTSISLAPSTEGFRPGLREVSGSSGTGSSWVFAVPQAEDGDAKIRKSFNQSMDDAAQRLIDGAKTDHVTVEAGTLEPADHTRAVVARTTLSGVLITMGYVKGAAHPSTSVATGVVDAGSGRTLTLDDLFTDPAAARAQLVALATAADPTGRLHDATVAPADLGPWIALDDGLHLYLPVIHAMGDYVPVTLGWPQVEGLLNPTGKLLFSS